MFGQPPEPGPHRSADSPAGLEASAPGYGRGAAILSVGIGVTGLITFAYFSLASYSLTEDEYGRITLLWSAVFITVSVLYRPVEQLLSRTIADRDARGVEGHEHLRVAATIQLALGLLFAVVALSLRGPLAGRPVRRLGDALLDPDRDGARLRGELLRARLPRRAPPLRALRRAGADGGELALPVRAGRGRGDRRGPGRRWRSAWRRRRSCRWPWCRGRSGAGCGRWRRRSTRTSCPTAARRARGSRARVHPRPRHRLRRRGAADHAREQTFLNAGPLLVEAAEGARGRGARRLHLQRAADRPRAAAALPGGADLDPPPPHAPAGRRRDRPVPPQREPHAHRDRRVRRRGGARDARGRPAAHGPRLRRRLRLRARRPRAGLARDGPLPRRRPRSTRRCWPTAAPRRRRWCWVACAAAFVLFLLLVDFDDRVLQVEVAFLGAAAILCALLYALYRRA